MDYEILYQCELMQYIYYAGCEIKSADVKEEKP